MDKMISTKALYGDYLAHARTYSHKYIDRKPNGHGGWLYTYPTDINFSGRPGNGTVGIQNTSNSGTTLGYWRGTGGARHNNSKAESERYRQADKASQIYKENLEDTNQMTNNRTTNNSRAREKNISGNGTGVYKRGEGTGIGPVGYRAGGVNIMSTGQVINDRPQSSSATSSSQQSRSANHDAKRQEASRQRTIDQRAENRDRRRQEASHERTLEQNREHMAERQESHDAKRQQVSEERTEKIQNQIQRRQTMAEIRKNALKTMTSGKNFLKKLFG